MELKGIDVSSFQENIDWAKVKASGIAFAILRITQRYGVDACFEKNLSGCKANGIPVGVYKYSYALSTAEIKKEAEGVIEALAGRGLDSPVWLDLEWDGQRENLTRDELSAMIKTFRAVIVAAGYKFGIYCNVDWYENVIPDDCKDYDFWIARYPASDTGVVTERLRPAYGVGWQYSAAGKVPGISGPVDMDVFYKDYSAQEEKPMDAWKKTKKLLDAQVGYLEKRNAANLDSKTANAGYNNYTKYSRDVNTWGKMGCQGQPWCATYQFWICAMIFGLTKALEIMGNGFYNCNSVKAHAKAKGTWHATPKLGALVIFRNGAHIGRVIGISGNTIRTNEGNTSAGGLNNVEANGGCVAEKSYTIGNAQIDGYVWIDYGTETAAPETPWKATGTATATVDNLYVRAEPNGEIIGELMKGNRFEINGVTSGKWTQVNVAGIGIGWVWTGYTRKDGTLDEEKSTITNKQDKTQRLFVGKVTASVLNVRTWAGTEFPQIKSYPQLSKGNLVDVMNYTQTATDGSKWYYVRIAGKYFGFVHSGYIQRQ